VSDFEDALRGMISGQNRPFEQADADLRAETSAASAGIGKLTNGRASLRLSSTKEEGSGVWYELWLLFGPHSTTEGADWTKRYSLGTFFVPWKGYPLRTGHGQELPDRPSIAAYFLAMAKDPTSPLVNYLTFNLRHQEQPTGGSIVDPENWTTD
jgi:hypothetical protein